MAKGQPDMVQQCQPPKHSQSWPTPDPQMLQTPRSPDGQSLTSLPMHRQSCAPYLPISRGVPTHAHGLPTVAMWPASY